MTWLYFLGVSSKAWCGISFLRIGARVWIFRSSKVLESQLLDFLSGHVVPGWPVKPRRQALQSKNRSQLHPFRLRGSLVQQVLGLSDLVGNRRRQHSAWPDYLVGQPFLMCKIEMVAPGALKKYRIYGFFEGSRWSWCWWTNCLDVLILRGQCDCFHSSYCIINDLWKARKRPTEFSLKGLLLALLQLLEDRFLKRSGGRPGLGDWSRIWRNSIQYGSPRDH